MIYSDFKGEKLSQLGFGTMRLPLGEDKEINEKAVARMIEYAISHGVNYFDTAFPYHGGKSEIVIRKVLSNYQRDKFYLATKFPGHQFADSYDVQGVFEKQLEKCGVDYFDFYLLHNVYEKSVPVYENPKWGIIDYLLEQKKNGRIKHLGFSCHAQPETLEKFLEKHANEMEFCQIQLNYLDWTLQNACKKMQILAKYNIPVWVMEPVRGGRLAKLDPESEAKLKAERPDESIASWAFRWLQGLPNVKVILSGMSNQEQMEDNVKTFSEEKPLTGDQKDVLENIAENMKKSLPCTECRYCCSSCPKGLNIPKLISAYNDARFGTEGGLTAAMFIESLPEDKTPSACIGCGRCARMCPQGIDIPAAMRDFTQLLDKKLPKWTEICKERAEAARKLEESKNK